MSSDSPVTRRFPARLFDVLWIALLAIYMLAGTPLVPFHGDESVQISMSRDYAYQFLGQDPARVRYSDNPINPNEQYLRLINGSVNKYTMGLAWHLAGLSVDDVNDEWAWEQSWDYNQQNNHAPSSSMLAAARWPSALFMTAGAALMFALGAVLGGRLTAYLASLYYALNPAILINGRRAMMEGSMIFFGIFVVVAGVWLLQNRTWWAAILLGVISGLALSSKHTNLFAVGAVFAACILYPMLMQKPERRKLGRYAGLVAMAGVISLLTFCALNSVWWGANPLQNSLLVVRLRQDLLSGQTAMLGGYADVADKIAGFVRQTLFSLPQYYEAAEWGGYIADQITRYEASVWRGVSVGGSWPFVIVFGVMIVIGVWALLRSPRITRPTRWLVGLWSLVIVVTILFLTPLEWQRYYLPVLPVFGLLAALGVTHVVRRIRRIYDVRATRRVAPTQL